MEVKASQERQSRLADECEGAHPECNASRLNGVLKVVHEKKLEIADSAEN
jgi:hypothetical protein